MASRLTWPSAHIISKLISKGKTSTSLIGAILKDEPPPVSSLRPLSPASLDRVVQKCLAKDPDARWQSAHDLHDELVWIASDTTSHAAIAAATTRPWRDRAGWIAALTIAIVSAAVVAFPELTRKAQISTDGGTVPMWRGDGRELFFVSLDDRLMVARIAASGQLETDAPSVLFSLPPGPHRYGTNAAPYAVARDGQRFLINTSVEEAPPITVLLNWKPKD